MHEYSKLMILTTASIFALLPEKGVAQITFQDPRAISVDAQLVSAHKGNGIDIGLTYQMLKSSPIELTASIMKIDDLEYTVRNAEFQHNYAHAQAGIKYNFSVSESITVSPEIGLNYAFLNHSGATIDRADKGWYFGTEAEWHYDDSLSFLISAQSYQKTFALEDETVWGVGIRYTPYPKYKSDTKLNRRRSSLIGLNSTSTVNTNMTPSLSGAPQVNDTAAQRPVLTAKITSTDKAGQTIKVDTINSEQSMLAAAKRAKVRKLPSRNQSTGDDKLQIGAFSMLTSIKHFISKNKLDESEVYVEERDGYFKLFLKDDSAALAKFESINNKTIGNTQYLLLQSSDSIELAANR